MAAAAGLPCTPHSANLSLVTLFTMHLLGAIPNAGKYLEFSIEGPDYYPWQEGLFVRSPYAIDAGKVTIPSEPGWGAEIEPPGSRRRPTGKAKSDARAEQRQSGMAFWFRMALSRRPRSPHTATTTRPASATEHGNPGGITMHAQYFAPPFARRRARLARRRPALRRRPRAGDHGRLVRRLVPGRPEQGAVPARRQGAWASRSRKKRTPASPTCASR